MFAPSKWFLEPVAIFFSTCCFEMHLLCLSLWECFLGGCRFENFFGAFLFEICFLALIAAKMIFCSCRFENDFLLLLLWKLFLAPVALKNGCRLPLWKLFFVLVPLNLILGASRFENFLVFLWKYLFGGHRFENSFLALVVLKMVLWHFSIFEKILRS